jgi:hypothetical protein
MVRGERATQPLGRGSQRSARGPRPRRCGASSHRALAPLLRGDLDMDRAQGHREGPRAPPTRPPRPSPRMGGRFLEGRAVEARPPGRLLPRGEVSCAATAHGRRPHRWVRLRSCWASSGPASGSSARSPSGTAPRRGGRVPRLGAEGATPGCGARLRTRRCCAGSLMMPPARLDAGEMKGPLIDAELRDTIGLASISRSGSSASPSRSCGGRVDLRARTLGASDPLTLAARVHLASALRRQGRECRFRDAPCAPSCTRWRAGHATLVWPWKRRTTWASRSSQRAKSATRSAASGKRWPGTRRSSARGSDKAAGPTYNLGYALFALGPVRGGRAVHDRGSWSSAGARRAPMTRPRSMTMNSVAARSGRRWAGSRGPRPCSVRRWRRCGRDPRTWPSRVTALATNGLALGDGGSWGTRPMLSRTLARPWNGRAARWARTTRNSGRDVQPGPHPSRPWAAPGEARGAATRGDRRMRRSPDLGPTHRVTLSTISGYSVFLSGTCAGFTEAEVMARESLRRPQGQARPAHARGRPCARVWALRGQGKLQDSGGVPA